jgi:hypothetical protein
MENKFYVGQEVVAISDHSQGYFKKGDEFIIKSISNTECCGICVLGIGIDTGYNSMNCTCGCLTNCANMFSSKRFNPKQHLSNTTYNEVMEWIKKGNEISILN